MCVFYFTCELYLEVQIPLLKLVVNFRAATETVMFTERRGLRFWVKVRSEKQSCDVSAFPWEAAQCFGWESKLGLQTIASSLASEVPDLGWIVPAQEEECLLFFLQGLTKPAWQHNDTPGEHFTLPLNSEDVGWGPSGPRKSQKQESLPFYFLVLFCYSLPI